MGGMVADDEQEKIGLERSRRHVNKAKARQMAQGYWCLSRGWSFKAQGALMSKKNSGTDRQGD